MHVALIGAALEENLALRYLATPLRAAGHRVTIMGYDGVAGRQDLARRVAAEPPDLIGMSVAFQHRLLEFRDLSRDLRAQGVTSPIVWGGHIPTARSGQILERYPEVDVIVRHDGEQTLVELASAMGASDPFEEAGPGVPREVPSGMLGKLVDIAGLAFRLPGGRPGMTEPRAALKDLDQLHYPVRDGRVAVHAGLPFVPILSSRGCWQHCTYCSIQTYHRGRQGPRVRLRSPEAVADEMCDLYFRRDARIFCFHDENFFLPRPRRTIPRLVALREALERRGVGRIGVVAKCRPDELSPEVLTEAKRLGLIRLYVGVENGSQAGLDHLGRDTTVAVCRQGLELLRDAGVYACFNVLLFEPDTTLADVEDNVAFLADTSDFPWNFCRTEVYPGSHLEERLSAAGRLRGGLEGMSYTIADHDAELLFRLTAVTMSGRNFGPQSVANTASGVGYLAAVLQHFYPGRAARAFGRRAERLIRQLGQDTLGHLSAALEHVRGRPSRGETTRFAVTLAERVSAMDAPLWAAFDSLQREMGQFGRKRAPALLRPVRGRLTGKAAAVAAATALSMAACDSDPAEYHVVDPVPEDVMVLDPLPPDVHDVMVVDVFVEDAAAEDAPDPGIEEDVMVVDPLPPDVVDEDSATDDTAEPGDVAEEPDADVMVVDPLPPDMGSDEGPVEDTAEPEDVEDTVTPVELPPVDPPPPDLGAAGPVPPATGLAAMLPLSRAFRVALDAAKTADGMRLTARVSGGGDSASVSWRSAGGRLTTDGAEAHFSKRGSGPAWVMVVARGDKDNNDKIDTARVLL